MPRSSVGDDIPLARRSRPRRPKGLGIGTWLRSLAVAAAAAGGALLLVLGPLRFWLQPAPVPGLNARLSADGRLLGHFPFPEAPRSELVSVEPGLQLRAEAAADFEAMRQAALRDGVQLGLLSAFRSIALQRQLFFEVGAARNQTAEARAKVSAPPGFSEHGTGYAVDLADRNAPATDLSPSCESTRAFQWLQQNAARYHFRLSFPRHNRQGVAYEPWHWRYEGSTKALKLFEPASRLSR
ncbi:MAG: D-alanyl-D-alanine carboxypeptidase family protein, partial [Synechococcaceae cyanobacterium]